MTILKSEPLVATLAALCPGGAWASTANTKQIAFGSRTHASPDPLILGFW